MTEPDNNTPEQQFANPAADNVTAVERAEADAQQLAAQPAPGVPSPDAVSDAPEQTEDAQPAEVQQAQEAQPTAVEQAEAQQSQQADVQQPQQDEASEAQQPQQDESAQ